MRNCTYILSSFLLLFSVMPLGVYAQSSQVLSVTPPLFQISVTPGDLWQSSLRVVNGNNYPLVVYAEVVNFEAEGEHGQGTFVPILEQDGTQGTLAEWIEIASGPYTIPPEKTKDIPFFVEVPETAPPGGHFAAILVGTQPPTDSNALTVQTAQTVTSLFFVRIEGDVVESGAIREFSVVDTFLDRPIAEFLLRFENKGNVHLQPRGDIVITNMWGSERGVIPINNKTHFGNVLPESIRAFHFSWKGEPSLTEIGRYKAVVTLAFGQTGIKNTTATTYFWVIPVKATLITLASVVGFVLFVTWLIRLYIRRMLALAGIDANALREERRTVRGEQRRITGAHKKVQPLAPILGGISDLLNRLRNVRAFFEGVTTITAFVYQYKFFFFAVTVLVGGFIGLVFYVSEASKEQRSYEVTIERPDGNTVITSEEILKDRLDTVHDPVRAATSTQAFELVLINASGEAGLAARTAIALEARGYTIHALESATEATRNVSALIYDDTLTDAAIALSTLFDGMLISPRVERASSTDMTMAPKIEVYLGTDVLEWEP